MDLLHVESKYSLVACSQRCARINAGCHLNALYVEVQEYFCAEQLVNFDR